MSRADRIKARTKRKETRQNKRTERQEKRQASRSRRTEARQSSRSQRQQTRQENRTRRTEGRQAIRKEKVIQKGQSGYWSPEGIEARGNRAGQIIGASGQLVGDLTQAGVAIGTGGISEMFGGGGGGLSDMFGGGGDDESQKESGMQTMNQGYDFSFSNPIVIGGAVAAAGLLYMLTRPKKRRSKNEE